MCIRDRLDVAIVVIAAAAVVTVAVVVIAATNDNVEGHDSDAHNVGIPCFVIFVMWYGALRSDVI